ncbi:hypothetical protein MW887_007595 [Aspergillus wentii]|nr:hypothetical protein MW887_007595 [Aspergillus wentii]
MRTKSTRERQESPDRKQDPIERRRLQNRLSQRNHRRKIRERMARLQELVVASELRAVANMNGWDQPGPLSNGYTTTFDLERGSPPFFDSHIPIHSSHLSHPSHSHSHSHSHSSSPSSSNICSSCNNPMGHAPAITSTPSSSLGSFNTSCASEYDTNSQLSSTLFNSFNTSMTPPNTLSPDPSLATPRTFNSTCLDPLLFSDSFNIQSQCPPTNLDGLGPDMPLPQTMPGMGASSPQPPGMSSPDFLEILDTSNVQSMQCLCHIQGSVGGSPNSMISGTWTGAGSYIPSCPLHKSQSSSNYQAMI